MTKYYLKCFTDYFFYLRPTLEMLHLCYIRLVYDENLTHVYSSANLNFHSYAGGHFHISLNFRQLESIGLEVRDRGLGLTVLKDQHSKLLS